ncbi:MAG: hypothetical protein R3Y23_02005 [Bacillota bacterium]
MAKESAVYDTYNPYKSKYASKKVKTKRKIWLGVLIFLVVVSLAILVTQLVLKIDIPELISGISGGEDVVTEELASSDTQDELA